MSTRRRRLRRLIATTLGVAIVAVLLTAFLFRDAPSRDGERDTASVEPSNTPTVSLDDEDGRHVPDAGDVIGAAFTFALVGLPSAGLLARIGGRSRRTARLADALAANRTFRASRLAAPAPPPAIVRARDGIAARVAAFTALSSRAAGHAGTSLPGVIAERVSPGVGARVAATLAGLVLVSGTNGKTTTTGLIVQLLEQAGRRVITNRSGANLATGVTAALLGSRPSGDESDEPPIAVLEVDEAALERVASELPVTVLVTTNLVRDQLDRFGETDELLRRWRRMIDALTRSTAVVACADDARVMDVARRARGPLRTYGLLGPPAVGVDPALTPEFFGCPGCDGALDRPWRGLGHLGDYRCRRCGFSRPDPWLGVDVIGAKGFDGSTLRFRLPRGGGERVVDLALPGVSSAYNAAAAVAAVSALGVSVSDAIDGLAGVRSPWGRYERIFVDGREVILALGKNPASVAEIVRIGAAAQPDAVLVVVNDAVADGRDASWYWDVDLSPLLIGRRYVLAGTRRFDLGLRLKYAGGERDQVRPREDVFVAQPETALDRLLGESPVGGRVLVVATYTGMLELRARLAARGLVTPLRA